MMDPSLNQRLTQVGPGTPGGELLRRYWMPVCPASELTAENPKKRVRILGENLVLFRNGRGEFGLLPERCPHRHVSLYFGFVEEDGLRCAYHGWKFAPDGTCIEQPFEPANSTLRKKACRNAYPVQQLAGILFAYLGPSPAPLLPRWETLVRTDGVRSIQVLPIHRCNWLQAQENSVDPVHTYYLHGHMLTQKRADLGPLAAEVAYFYRPIENYDFQLCEEPAWTGIRKIRSYGGDRPERESGHPMIFPNILVSPQGKALVIHWRVPVDDTHTYIIWSEFTANPDGTASDQRESEIPVTYQPHPLRTDGEYDLREFYHHDLMAWETQGDVFDRPTELLGTSDRGVVMLRRLLQQQIDAVAEGREPVGVIRDPATNETIRLSISSGLNALARALDR
jgi:5,5'-dehydrodivanillate O-demethylase